MIKTHPVESSMIREIGHDNEARVLVVEFKNGDRWKYKNVSPKIYNKMKDAPSVGRFFLRNIKPVCDAEKIIG